MIQIIESILFYAAIITSVMILAYSAKEIYRIKTDNRKKDLNSELRMFSEKELEILRAVPNSEISKILFKDRSSSLEFRNNQITAAINILLINEIKIKVLSITEKLTKEKKIEPSLKDLEPIISDLADLLANFIIIKTEIDKKEIKE